MFAERTFARIRAWVGAFVAAFFLLLASGHAANAQESATSDVSEIKVLQQNIKNARAEITALSKERKVARSEDVRARLDRQIAEQRILIRGFRGELGGRLKEFRHMRDLRRKGWRMVYRDEFRGSAINSRKWSHEVNCWGGGNNEKQCYTDRPDNSYVKDGFLHIVAKEEAFSGPGLPDDDPNYDPADTSVTLPFTSARLRSKGKMDFTYGRVEVRAKVTGGQGMWPAIWMLPTDYVYGGWPSSGEIDIFEAVNLGVWANEVHGTLHYGLLWPQWENHGATLPLDFNPADDFHTYAVEWEADEIRWYLDGQHYQTQRSEGWYNYVWQGQNQGFNVANPRAPFDQDFHLILNVAAGGDWPGNPDTGWTEDREMIVDYVRVYQCRFDRETGEGCGTADESVAVNTDAGAPGINDYLFYADGVETVALDNGGSSTDNTPQPGFWELNEGSLSQSETDLGGERGVVWEVSFGGLSNVFLTAQDMSEVDGFNTGVSMVGGSGWTLHGELEFDMYVESAAPDSQFLVKLDSGWPNQGQIAIDIPSPGSWQKVAVKVGDLMANANPSGGGVDITNILNPFVLEYSGSGASVKLDNIRLQCAYNTEPESWQLDQTCALAPLSAPVVPTSDEHDVYVDEITDWQPYDCCGGSAIAEIDDGGNNVLQMTYDSDPNTNTVTFFGLSVPRDMSHYAGGTLEFDMKVLQQPSNPAGTPWLLKVDCDTGCSTGDRALSLSQEGVTPGTGSWQHYTFNVNDLVSWGMDLSKVTAIVIFPAWGNQTDAIYQLDNIQWKVGSGPPPPPPAGPFNVTFSVDMSDAGLAPTDVTYVNGTFNGWCGDCNPMTFVSDDVWSLTIPLPVGVYDYKFTINGWAAQETVREEAGCGVNKFGFVNREVAVVDQDVTIALTPYSGCPSDLPPPPPPPPAGPFDVTFSVDMSAEGLLPGDVAYVNGTFNGWCGGCNPLTLGADDVWSATLPLPAGVHDYKFTINAWEAQEAVPEGPGCGINKGGFVNREVTVVDGAVVTEVTPYSGCPGSID